MTIVTGGMNLKDRARQAADQASRQASAPGWVQCVQSLDFTGHGDVDFDPVPFDVPMLDEPAFTVGGMLLARPNPDEYRLPIYGLWLDYWIVNTSGHYVGAKLSGAVYIDPLPNVEPTAAPVAICKFNVVFTGTGFKDTSTAELTGSPDRKNLI